MTNRRFALFLFVNSCACADEVSGGLLTLAAHGTECVESELAWRPRQPDQPGLKGRAP